MFRLQLRELRKQAGFKTQKEIAAAMGIKERRYASWEREEVSLTLEDACALCDVLGCTPNDLCGWYISHPEDRPREPERPPELTRDERLLVECNRDSTPEQRAKLLDYARERRDISFREGELGMRSEGAA